MTSVRKELIFAVYYDILCPHKGGFEMLIKKGNTRIVVLIGPWAFKFPIIRWRFAYKFYRHYGSQVTLRFFRRYNVWQMGSVRFALLNGIATNWYEYRFYCHQKTPYLAPTVFSFFGLFNAQKQVVPIERDRYAEVLGAAKINSRDCIGTALHEFLSESNFGILRGYMVMVDYGHYRVRDVLLKYHDAIIKTFKI